MDEVERKVQETLMGIEVAKAEREQVGLTHITGALRKIMRELGTTGTNEPTLFIPSFQTPPCDVPELEQRVKAALPPGVELLSIKRDEVYCRVRVRF